MTLRMAAHYCRFDQYTDGFWNYSLPPQADIDKYKAAGFNSVSFGEIRYGQCIQDFRDIFAGNNGWSKTNNPFITAIQRIKAAGMTPCVVLNPNRYNGIDGFLNRPADVAEFMEHLKYMVSIGIGLIEFEETAFYATKDQVLAFWRQCRSLTPGVLLGCNMPSTQQSSVTAEGFDFVTINNEKLIDFVFPQPGKGPAPDYLITNEIRQYAYNQWKLMMPNSAIVPFCYKTYDVPVTPGISYPTKVINNVNLISNVQQGLDNSWGVIIFPSSDLSTSELSTYKTMFAREKGTVSVSSVPPGASVRIDNISVGITPITVFNPVSLEPGTHTIQLSLPGYNTGTGTFVVVAGQNTITSYTLTNEPVTPQVTTILIIGCNEAVKEGQTCQLIGNCLDQNNAPIACSQLSWGSSNAALATVDTNGKVTGVSAGAVTIAAVKGTVAGYRDVTILTSKGSLNASSSPAGAKILINDIDTGKVTPALITGILEGQISIKLVKSGFVDIFDTAEIVAGQTITKAYTMVAVIENGTLNVSSIPSNAYIIVDDVPTTEVTPQILSLSPGRHIIKLVLSGYEDVNDSEYFYEGQQIIKLYTLQKKSSGIASLAIPITLGLGLLSLLKK